MTEKGRAVGTVDEAGRRCECDDPPKESEMSVISATVDQWIPIVRGEFQEVPGLHLTKPQVRRLWGLDPPTCDALLDALVDGRFLKRTHDGAYARADASD